MSLKKDIVEYMFSQSFYRLFLHWSWNVRDIFYHLLLFRLYYTHHTRQQIM